MKGWKRIINDIEEQAAKKVEPFFPEPTIDLKQLRKQTILMIAAIQPELMRAYTEGVLFAREILKGEGTEIKISGAKLSFSGIAGMVDLTQRDIDMAWEQMAGRIVIDYEWMRLTGMSNEGRAAMFATGDGEKRWLQAINKVQRIMMNTVNRISDAGYYDGLTNHAV